MKSHQIPLRQFIEEALFGKDGYYNTKVAIGDKDDFVTFAERWAPLYANRCFYAWQAMLQHGDIKADETFYIYEFGAGTGLMAARFLQYLHGRALLEPNSDWQRFYKQLHYVIGEISPRLIAQQQTSLQIYLQRNKASIYKTDARQVDTALPSGAGVVISNELIDTFPPHELIVDEDTVTATVVNTGKTNSPEQLPIEDVLSQEDQAFAKPAIDSCRQLAKKLPHAICVRPDISNYYRKLHSVLTRGYVFTIDYGFDAHIDAIRDSNTLRTYSATYGYNSSLYEHKGEVDITGDINFSHMEQIGRQQGFEFTYFGMQDSVGGVPICDFAILMQRKDVNPACDAIVCQGMKKSSPVRFEEMPATKCVIEQGLKLLNNVEVATKAAVPYDDPIAFNDVMLELHNRLEVLFAWFLQQEYLVRDRQFFTPINESFSLAMLTVAGGEYTNQVIIKLIENKLYAKLLLTMLTEQLESTINTPDQDLPEYLASIKTPRMILTYFIAKQHEDLAKSMLNNQDAVDYNLLRDTKETIRSSLLTLCLNAAKKSNAVFIGSFNLFKTVKITSETQRLTHRFQ